LGAARASITSKQRFFPTCYGKEFAAFNSVEEQTGVRIYFADPYAAWQRGCNENANGLLRQYVPKGTEIDAVCPQQLANAVEQINNRPRKCLGYKSPAEVFHKQLRGALGT
jgi:IS30 family transposase